MEELLSITDIVNEYRVSRKTVQRWVSAEPPKIDPVKTLGGKTGAHLFTRSEADRAFAEHKKIREDRALAKEEALLSELLDTAPSA